MADYIELGQVRTWYEDHGSGHALVMLHPGGVDARAFAPNIDALAAQFRVLTPERRGHGHTPDVDGPISYELMAADTIAFLEVRNGAKDWCGDRDLRPRKTGTVDAV
jgi:pimeloyl-ACP methyl ester carboxylesterase